MTTLFDDPNYGMYENQGGILQTPGQDAPGIALSDPAQSVLPQSNTQDLRRNAIAQMGTGQKILSAIGEFGAGVQGHPSPLNAQIRQQREDSLMKVQEFKAHSDALEDGVKMAQRMTGDARTNFITQYAKQLESVRPGLGDTYATLANQPDSGTVLAKYSDKSPTLKRAVELDPSGGAALKLLSSPEAMKTINAEIDSNVMPTLSKKGQTFLMGWQQLVPKEMADKINEDGRVSAAELLKANDWIRANKPDLAKTLAFSDEDLQIIGRNEDAFYGSLGMLTPKDDREIARKKAEDKGKREVTEIGVGKDAKGNDIFQKAYIEGGNVVQKVGEPYQKKDGVNVTVGGMVPVIDNNPKSKTYGKQVFAQADKQGGAAHIVPNVIPPNSAGISEDLRDVHGEEFLKTLPPDQAQLIKSIDEGRAPITAIGRGAQREKILGLVGQYNPQFDGTNYAARQATRKDFTSGTTAKNVTAINTAIGHIGTLDELQEAMRNNDVKGLNAVMNQISQQTGKPNVTNVEVAKGAVANELMRVFRQVGASETEVKDWEKKFSSSNSPDQMHQANAVAVDLLQSRINALNDQWNRGMNSTTGYPGLISKTSQSVLDRIANPVQVKGSAAGNSGAPTPLKFNAKPDPNDFDVGDVLNGPDGSMQLKIIDGKKQWVK